MNRLVVLRRLTLLTLLLFATGPVVRAQVLVQVTIAPPSWGPPLPPGSRYYYLPEMDGYYDGQARQYVVQRNGHWVRTGRPAGYETSQFHPVIVVDYGGLFPWFCHDDYRARYPARWEDDDDEHHHYRQARHEESDDHHREHSAERRHDNEGHGHNENQGGEGEGHEGDHE